MNTDYLFTSSALINKASPDENKHAGPYDCSYKSQNAEKGILFGMPSFADILYKKINFASFTFWGGYSSGAAAIYPCTDAFDSEDVTWNTAPERISENSSGNWSDGSFSAYVSIYISSINDPEKIKQFLDAPAIYFNSPAATSVSSHYTSGNRPSVNIYYDDVIITSKITAKNSPTSGSIDISQDTVFSWYFKPSGICIGSFVQSSATFKWRANGSAWNNINLTNEQSITIPGNTFPAGAIEWQVSGTDFQGNSTSTPVYSVTSADSLITASAIKPASSVEKANTPILFIWNADNPSGNLPTKSELRWKLNNGDWNTVYINNGDTSYTAPANTFPAGTIEWQVKSYNLDNVPGEWSTEVFFISLAGPPAPSISTNEKPFLEISWQANGQQAYQINIDGKTAITKYGTEKKYTVKEPLSDGYHTINVKIQGLYGLWSEAGEAQISVENEPGESVDLSARNGTDTALTWECESINTEYLIYRDSRLIGKTTNFAFVDRLTTGTHSYFVINKLANGNYTKSNTVSGSSGSSTPAICEFPGGEWMKLKLSERSNREQNYSYSRTAAARHVMGAEYPVIELSEFSDMSASYDAAFVDMEEARAFERMKGKIVLIKSRMAAPIVAAMTSLEKKTGDFYLSYTFTVQRIHWEDFVDETNGQL